MSGDFGLDSFGGGMSNFQSGPTVTECMFVGNDASSGGGMANRSSSPTVTNCTFTGNSATSFGGGMFNFECSATVTNCTFTGNSAESGGGMVNSVSSPTVTNCTLSANSAIVFGGGIASFSGSPTVTNCILWGDSPDEISGGGTVSYSDVQGSFPGTGNIDADPLFVDPDNGDYRLLAGSPCIDAGDNTAVPQDITTDLDGNPRFVDDSDTPDSGNGDPPIVDMGAYEFQGTSPAHCPWECEPVPDGTVGINDFLELLAQWGQSSTSCDFAGCNTVGIEDFLALLAHWGGCFPPTGACCCIPGGCVFRASEICDAQGGTYLGDGALCEFDPCPPGGGACCLPDGSCALLSLTCCTTAGGSFQGENTICGAAMCGACCLPAGPCVILSSADCTAVGGTSFQGGACPTSNCCFVHPGGGCDDGVCSAAICSINPTCCQTWDQLCAFLAQQVCGSVCAPCSGP